MRDYRSCSEIPLKGLMLVDQRKSLDGIALELEFFGAFQVSRKPLAHFGIIFSSRFFVV